MATETYAGPLGECRILGASKGVSLSTTAAFTAVPQKTTHLFLTPRNFATAVVAKYSLNPYLVVLKTANRMGTITDYSDYAQDGSDSTDVTLSSLDTLANGDWLLLGAHLPFRGFWVDVDSTNSTATTTMACHYWQDTTTDAWASLSVTEGSKSSTSFDQDGLNYWTVPTDWKTAKLSEIYTGAYATSGTSTVTGSPLDLKPGLNTVTCTGAGNLTVTLPTGGYGIAKNGTATMSSGSGVLTTASANTIVVGGNGTIIVDIPQTVVTYPYANTPLYWLRVTFDKALDSSTTLNALLCANRSTSYAELLSGQCFESKVHVGPNGIGCIEALTDAGTGNLIVNGCTNGGSGF